MKSKIYLKSLVLLCACFFVIGISGCDKDKDEATPAYKIEDFVGSWIATSVIHSNNADPGETFEFVANGGEVRFTMLDGGYTRTWVELGPFSDEWDALITLDGNTITSTPEESIRPVRVSTLTYDGTTLMLTNVNDMFDFTLTGNPATVVTTTSVATFIRH